MKLSLRWLRDFVDVDLPPAELASRITDSIAEVDGYEVIGKGWAPEHITVAEVVAVEPHPNADRLSLATVETASGRKTVVCGAPNVAPGQKVAFATEGAHIIDGHTGEPSVLKLRPIRGVDSAGMVLSEKELGLSDEHEGILVLPPDAVIGRPLAEQLGDVVFDISTWANRADLLGVLGLAREVAAVLGAPCREPELTVAGAGPPVATLVQVTVEDPDLCPRFTASVIQGLTIAPSPAWMQERLLRHGMRPINNVVDITNFVMLETGQPLHAFDYDLVRGHRIVARRAKPGERLTTLDGVDRELAPHTLMICDAGGPVGIAGIMGGGNSEVTSATRTVLLEVANFNPASIRRSSGLLKLRTEASSRFEKGIHPAMAAYAQQRALHLFERLTGAQVSQGLVDVYPVKPEAHPIAVPTARIRRVLGIDVPVADVQRILGALGFQCETAPDGYSVTAPPWRTDLEIADDVIEEVARIYGYDKLPSTDLAGQLPPVEPSPLEDARERLRDLAVGCGFQEVITYSLTALEPLERAVEPGDTRRMGPLSVVNPVASQHTYLRTTMRPSLLQAYSNNRHLGDGPLRLFEIGFEYLPVEGDLPHERPVLCAVVGGGRESRWPAAPSRDRLDFYDAKGALEAVLAGLGVDCSFEAATVHGFLPGHTARVLAGPTEVGVVGQVHPQLAASFDIDEPVFLAELWLEDLLAAIPARPAYSPTSRYPELRHDLALVVDLAVPAGAVVRLIKESRLIAGAEIFDDYRGTGVPEGKKSLAVRLRYQANDRTLTDADVAKVQAGILMRLEREFGATLRGA